MTARLTEETDTITLADAAQHFGFSVSTLRAEADRGRLTIYRIGRRLYTTPADIKEMVQQCRVDQKARGFISTRSVSNTSSETERASSALAAARETALKLKGSSRNTSVISIGRNRQVRR
jgi:DNA-binding transcriptional MerR regulator